MPTLGIWLDRRVLRRVKRGGRSYEKVHYYTQAARSLGVTPLYFDLDGIDMRRRKVQGYIPHGRKYRRVVRRIPGVIHRRANTYRPGNGRKVRYLGRVAKVYNPWVSFDKYRVYKTLRRDPELRPHLPTTWRLTAINSKNVMRLLKVKGALFLKPRRGSVGRGVAKVVARGGHFTFTTGTGHIRYSYKGLMRRLRRLAATRQYVAQSAIDLARDDGRVFDLRVAVQKDESGSWSMIGMVAKRAGRGSFLTNLARGATAHGAKKVFRTTFPHTSPQVIQERVERVAIRAARRLGETNRLLADLGLDIGLDRDGNPWIIEVNRRDQRYSFLAAGEHRKFYRLYYNPVSFGKSLLSGVRQREQPSRGVRDARDAAREADAAPGD